MKVIQIVVEEAMLGRIDTLAKRRGLSRSAFIRSALEAKLVDERIAVLVDAERSAYAKHPPSAAERAAFEALSEGQDRALALLAAEEEEEW